MGPISKGLAGEMMSEAEAIAAGETIRGRQVTFELPSGNRTRPDLLTEMQTSSLKIREAKNGPTATLSEGQKELRQVIQNGGVVIPRGARVKEADLKVGEPLRIENFELDRY